MRRTAWPASVFVLLVLTGIAPAAAALPQHGVLIAGRSLGGIRLREPAVRVEAALGPDHGVCRRCTKTTWYFQYKPYDAHGLAVELTKGRVSGLYTVDRPAGWRGPGGLELGASQGQVVSAAGPLVTVQCSTYDVLVRDSRTARTAYYLANGQLWAFGLFRRAASPCR
jgi:hypothetical protein